MEDKVWGFYAHIPPKNSNPTNPAASQLSATQLSLPLLERYTKARELLDLDSNPSYIQVFFQALAKRSTKIVLPITELPEYGHFSTGNIGSLMFLASINGLDNETPWWFSGVRNWVILDKLLRSVERYKYPELELLREGINESATTLKTLDTKQSRMILSIKKGYIKTLEKGNYCIKLTGLSQTMQVPEE